MSEANLKAKFTADGTGFVRETEKIKSSVESLQKNLESVNSGVRAFFGLEAIMMIKEFGGKIVESVIGIKHLSEQFDISTDDVQRFQKAAAKAGLEFEDLAGAMDKVNQARQEALRGNEKMALSFQKLGISAKDVLNTEGVGLAAFSERVFAGADRIKNESERRALLRDVGGRGAARAAAGFNELSEPSSGSFSEGQIGFASLLWSSFKENAAAKAKGISKIALMATNDNFWRMSGIDVVDELEQGKFFDQVLEKMNQRRSAQTHVGTGRELLTTAQQQLAYLVQIAANTSGKAPKIGQYTHDNDF